MPPPARTCILAATDLSPHAVVALERAAQLARSRGSQLHVVHVVDPATTDLDLDDARQLLDRQTAPLTPTPTNAVRSGHAFVEIVDHARQVDAGLVVVGARGWHALGERVIGTTAERVVRHGDHPVLVVRAEPGPTDYQDILVGVDLSDACADALRFTRATFQDARITAANICVAVGEHRLRLSGDPQDRIADLRRAAADAAADALGAWLDHHHLDADVRLTRAGWPSTDLAALAEADGYDLVVVASRGMAGVRYVLLGSVAQRVLRECPLDVLVVRAGSGDPAAALARQ